jgi:hypothetical protein
MSKNTLGGTTMTKERLTDYHKQEIKRLYADGLKPKEIWAKMPDITLGKITGYIGYYHLPTKEECEQMEREKLIVKEMPPIYKSPVTVRVDRVEVERIVTELKLPPVKCRLGETEKAFNLNNMVIGSSFHRNGRRGQI